MDKIAVLIPCYNEVATIAKVVRDFRSALPDAVIYVYDNNSTDDSAEAAHAAGAVVRQEFMQGKGNVIRRMFREVDAECYILVDGDDTYPAEAAPAMCRFVLEEEADMVVGDRLSSTYFRQNKRHFHSSGNTLVRKMINRLFHTDVKDIMTGCRAFSYNFVKTFPVLSRGFEIETEMTIHAVIRNMRIVNHVLAYRNRPAGSVSKLNTFSDGGKVLLTIFRLWKNFRPLSFFTTVAVLMTLTAAVVMMPVLEAYFLLGTVERFPTLIVCGFLVLAALQAFWSGLILSTIEQKNRSDFEFQLQSAANRLKELKNKKDA